MFELVESDIHIPVSGIGKVQRLDMSLSSSISLFNRYFRVCTVLKGPNLFSSNGDKSPYRMSSLFGKDVSYYNNHIIFQVSTCPFKCPYCYLDRLKNDILITASDIVDRFKDMRNEAKKMFQVKINVLHMMGGDPAIYAKFWPRIRSELDKRGCKDVILYSDCLMVEDYYYNVKPWEFTNINNFILVCSIKGSNWSNMIYNTGGYDKFTVMLEEAKHYLDKENIYFTAIGYNPDDLIRLNSVFSKEKLDLLNINMYQVSKRRFEGLIE